MSFGRGTVTSVNDWPVSARSVQSSGRTWDYRYCWLRDAYYVLSALRLIGHFEEREQFIRYLLNIAGNHPSMDLAPLYRVDGSGDLKDAAKLKRD